MVTFDQPLWHKSLVLTKHLNLPVVNLLGNFHTQMSFMGSIGYVMANSGLEQALSLIYGEEAIKWILCGKSYERAMRCHGPWAGGLSFEEDSSRAGNSKVVESGLYQFLFSKK